MKHLPVQSLLAMALISLVAVSAPRASQLPGPPELQGMNAVGEARMRVLFWDIYDARLLAPDGRLEDSRPFALSLTYLRALEGRQIAARSIEEIRKQGYTDEATLDRWLAFLTEVIPDVRETDEIIGYATAGGSTRFYRDGVLIGAIDDPRFTQAFFDIWLGEESSEPELRDQLLGLR